MAYNKSKNCTNQNLILHDDLFCKYCGKQCKNLNSLKQHEIRCKSNPNRVKSVYLGGNKKGYVPVCAGWNKNLTAIDNPALSNGAKTVKERYKGKPGRLHTEDEKLRISVKMRGNHNSDVNKTGRGKKGYYKGLFCASTYELAFVIYCLDHHINISRFKGWYEYEYLGVKHRYYPDFIIDDVIYEIKGFWTPQVDAKTRAVTDRQIKILYREDMSEVFDYILKTYNKTVDKNIQDLYE